MPIHTPRMSGNEFRGLSPIIQETPEFALLIRATVARDNELIYGT